MLYITYDIQVLSMYIISNIFTFVSHNFHQFVSNAGDAGLYQIQNGSTFCLPCLTGTFQNKRGRSLCKGCPVGFSNGGTQKELCAPCSPGTYQDEGKQADCKGMLYVPSFHQCEFLFVRFVCQSQLKLSPPVIFFFIERLPSRNAFK